MDKKAKLIAVIGGMVSPSLMSQEKSLKIRNPYNWDNLEFKPEKIQPDFGKRGKKGKRKKSWQV